jgi:hypothetical protein
MYDCSVNRATVHRIHNRRKEGLAGGDAKFLKTQPSFSLHPNRGRRNWTQKVSFTAPWNTRAPYEVSVDVIWPKVDETNEELDPRLPLLPGAAKAG